MIEFFLDDYLREREINHQYFRLLLLPFFFPIWQLAQQAAKELEARSGNSPRSTMPRWQSTPRFFNSVKTLFRFASSSPRSLRITLLGQVGKTDWSPCHTTTTATTMSSPRWRRIGKTRRGEEDEQKKAIKSRLSQFNTDPIMWYPETQADFQSSASIHVKHIVLVFLKKGVKSSPKGCWCKRSETHDPMSS